MRVVALGGGHGLSTAITALRRVASDITAIVTVADDGGSSGRLVTELGVPPPGDARRCLLALTDESELGAVFGYRFHSGALDGHALGNLVLAALADMTGSFTEALERARDLLGAHGTVLPAAVEPVRLVAEAGGVRVEGQSAVTRTPGIRHVALDPPGVAAEPAAVAAIGEADLVVVGPGSLYTSLVPAICVPGILDALDRCTAPRVFVCNLAVQEGETQGMDATAHLEALLEHTHRRIVDVMLVNDARVALGEGLDVPTEPLVDGVAVVAAPLAAERGVVHDPERLARALRLLTELAPGSSSDEAPVS